MHNMEKELTNIRKKHLEQRDPIVQQLQGLIENFNKSQAQLVQSNQDMIQRTINQQLEKLNLSVQV
jgi:flagellar hook-associated protein FlgK